MASIFRNFHLSNLLLTTVAAAVLLWVNIVERDFGVGGPEIPGHGWPLQCVSIDRYWQKLERVSGRTDSRAIRWHKALMAVNIGVSVGLLCVVLFGTRALSHFGGEVERSGHKAPWYRLSRVTWVLVVLTAAVCVVLNLQKKTLGSIQAGTSLAAFDNRHAGYGWPFTGWYREKLKPQHLLKRGESFPAFHVFEEEGWRFGILTCDILVTLCLTLGVGFVSERIVRYRCVQRLAA